jgi:hypothetical protein
MEAVEQGVCDFDDYDDQLELWDEVLAWSRDGDGERGWWFSWGQKGVLIIRTLASVSSSSPDWWSWDESGDDDDEQTDEEEEWDESREVLPAAMYAFVRLAIQARQYFLERTPSWKRDLVGEAMLARRTDEMINLLECRYTGDWDVLDAYFEDVEGARHVVDDDNDSGGGGGGGRYDCECDSETDRDRCDASKC